MSLIIVWISRQWNGMIPALAESARPISAPLIDAFHYKRLGSGKEMPTYTYEGESYLMVVFIGFHDFSKAQFMSFAIHRKTT